MLEIESIIDVIRKYGLIKIKIDYINLLSELTVVNNISDETFMNQIEEIYKNGIIYVVHNDGEVIASGTIFIEKKIIHNCSNVGHIEDIVAASRGRAVHPRAKS